jgi:hypothetical protein
VGRKLHRPPNEHPRRRRRLKAGSNTTLECSYIHDQSSFASDPNQGGGPTHNDAIQILDGTGIHIVGNQLVAAMDQNAAIQVTQDFGASATCTWNRTGPTAAAAPSTSPQGCRLADRRPRHRQPLRPQLLLQLPHAQEHPDHPRMVGNVWDDDSTPVPVQTHD